MPSERALWKEWRACQPAAGCLRLLAGALLAGTQLVLTYILAGAGGCLMWLLAGRSGAAASAASLSRRRRRVDSRVVAHQW